MGTLADLLDLAAQETGYQEKRNPSALDSPSSCTAPV